MTLSKEVKQISESKLEDAFRIERLIKWKNLRNF